MSSIESHQEILKMNVPSLVSVVTTHYEFSRKLHLLRLFQLPILDHTVASSKVSFAQFPLSLSSSMLLTQN